MQRAFSARGRTLPVPVQVQVQVQVQVRVQVRSHPGRDIDDGHDAMGHTHAPPLGPALAQRHPEQGE
jgi:hypothetical protein